MGVASLMGPIRAWSGLILIPRSLSEIFNLAKALRGLHPELSCSPEHPSYVLPEIAVCLAMFLSRVQETDCQAEWKLPGQVSGTGIPTVNSSPSPRSRSDQPESQS